MNAMAPIKKKLTGSEAAAALRKVALRYPDAEEGIACQGTALECSAFKARKKAFFFLGRGDARLKLVDSQGEAKRLAAAEPQRYRVGAQGWVTIKFAEAEPLPVELLAKWVDESYQVVTGKVGTGKK